MDAGRITFSGTENEDLAQKVALAFYVAANQVSEADGKIDQDEVEASFAVLLRIAKDSKSELLRSAATIFTSEALRPIVSSAEIVTDDEVLEDLGRKMKQVPLNDQYRIVIAFLTLCREVGKASGGGLMGRGRISEAKKAATENMVAALAGSDIGQPLSDEYRVFLAAAEKYCSDHGL